VILALNWTGEFFGNHGKFATNYTKSRGTPPSAMNMTPTGRS